MRDPGAGAPRRARARRPASAGALQPAPERLPLHARGRRGSRRGGAAPDATRGGAGIGLAIVKQTVEACGGRVGAESGAGRTRFWFSLPA
ncbi:MAG: HAMP domain-containing histidine kinase [Chloroflexi bacterium]|nr:MAG: HAMP domain-containing histidine kinase [Chloroflexota bacterium]